MRKCLIADDHEVVRSGLARMLALEYPHTVFGGAADSQATLALVQNEPWDLLILDLNLPGRGGLEVLQQVKAVTPRLPVVVFSMHPEEQYGPRALRAGASGFLSKEASSDQILAAVRMVLSGRKYVSPALSEELASRLASPQSDSPEELLSDRELQVLRLLAEGHSVGNIAERLALSVKTVSTYRARILEKLRLKSTADLVRYALDQRLTDSRSASATPRRQKGT